MTEHEPVWHGWGLPADLRDVLSRSPRVRFAHGVAELFDLACGGAAILRTFFHKHLAVFLEPEMSALGRRIIACCLEGGSVEDYEAILGRAQ